jgi:hypothetical protein
MLPIQRLYSLLIVLSALVTGPIHLTAQSTEQSLNLGPVTLSLGMSKEGARTQITEYFSINETGDDLWVILDGSPPNVEFVGAVSFTDGRLSYIKKDWGPEDSQKGADFAETLYGAFSELVGDGTGVCIVHVSQRHGRGMEAKSIEFSCGARRIEVDAIGYKSGVTASVSEILAKRED